MKALSKKERKEIYLEVAEIFSGGTSNHPAFGMCFYIKEILMRIGYKYGFNYSSLFNGIMDEFVMISPPNKTARDYWGVTDSERAIIMCFCAAMCD